MIISASRRTDLPAFHTRWFMERIRAGFCSVRNPFNAAQVSHISLAPADVDALVFWTRFPRPLQPFLDELDARGFRYYFLFTLLDYPSLLEPRGPRTSAAIRVFRDLAQRIGPERVIWRYDPIVPSTITDAAFHLRTFEKICASLEGHTRRCVVSVLENYRKIRTRMRALETRGIHLLEPEPGSLETLLADMAACAQSHGMEVRACAQETDYRPQGVAPNRCVDPELLNRLFGLNLPLEKDSSQRPHCGCAPSRDIGAYDTCGFSCAYCYANSNFARSRARIRAQDVNAESLGDGGEHGPHKKAAGIRQLSLLE